MLFYYYLDTHEIDGIEGEILKKLNEKFGKKNQYSKRNPS